MIMGCSNWEEFRSYTCSVQFHGTTSKCKLWPVLPLSLSQNHKFYAVVSLFPFIIYFCTSLVLFLNKAPYTTRMKALLDHKNWSTIFQISDRKRTGSLRKKKEKKKEMLTYLFLLLFNRKMTNSMKFRKVN